MANKFVLMYRPGGTIRDVDIVLQPEALLPIKFNIPEARVWRENPEDRRNWVVVKELGAVLPDDSPELDFPITTLLTVDSGEGGDFDHVDIISLDESSGSGPGPGDDSGGNLVP